jgi:ribosomal protein S18 acetylase RimI-like enzyme
VKLATWTPKLLPAVVRFWNRCFAAKRHYYPMTEKLFRERVTKAEAFDPRSFVVAREGEEVVGLLHSAVRNEDACRALDADWPGGVQGYVAFLYVEPSYRRKGIGDALWHRAIERLKATRQVTLDGQCLNPFYGNSEGPFTPFWGTPEGVSVEWDDSPTKKWLARKGFAPRFKGVQLGIDVGPGPGAEEVRKALARLRTELRALQGQIPELGRPATARRAIRPGLDFECVQAVRGGRTAGVISVYPLREVRSDLWAIYEASVVEEQRGKALGRRLLEAALDRIRARGGTRCEVLTLPDLSPGTFKLYTAAGFTPACRWAIY